MSMLYDSTQKRFGKVYFLPYSLRIYCNMPYYLEPLKYVTQCPRHCEPYTKYSYALIFRKEKKKSTKRQNEFSVEHMSSNFVKTPKSS
jgi:hypothetical protein